MSDLRGKIAIVTGADSTVGIGAATARSLALKGARVVVSGLGKKHGQLRSTEGKIKADSDPSCLQELVAEIRAMDGEAISVEVDISNPDEINHCINMACQEFGGIDILVNNAGTSLGSKRPFVDIGRECWEHLFAVNVLGAQHFCRQAIPLMKERKGGSIINMSSGLGLGAMPNMSAYITTKFALVGLTKSIASEVGKFNIRCNAICPGIIDTYAAKSSNMAMADLMGITLEEMEKGNSEVAALGRYGSADEIASTVAWLAGDGSKYVTGAAIPVTGGLPLGI